VRKGLGSLLRCLIFAFSGRMATTRWARELGAEVIETVVLSSNEDGLRFALKHGFVETERYLLPGDSIPWIDLRLAR